jgi:hypothetical protein
MSKISDDFEMQIARIHSLIEQDGSEVKWDDKIPDPDNPSQMRQIDVTVRRDDALTLIECRIHKERQDVKWIEELIGRRASLQADAVVAVSASGFTSGAILKAKSHGIILRDLVSLTEQEISRWGHKTEVTVTFYKFENIMLMFEFDKQFANRIALEDVERALISQTLQIAAIFDRLVDHLRKEHPDLPPMGVNARLTPKEPLDVNGIPIRSIYVDLTFSTVSQELFVPAVVAYDSPEANALERNTYVEQVELGQFQIAQSADIVSVAMDTSLLKIPNECKFGSVGFKFTRPVEMKEVTFLGTPDLGIRIGPSEIGIRFV